MSEPDTSAEAVKTLAAVFARRSRRAAPGNGVIYGTIAVTLRALLSERDAARAMLAEALPEATHDSSWGRHGASTVTGSRPPSLQALEQRFAAIEERMRNR